MTFKPESIIKKGKCIYKIELISSSDSCIYQHQTLMSELCTGITFTVPQSLAAGI